MTLYKDAVGGDHQSVTYIVAASDSLCPKHADYVCDGSGDQTTIQAAINELPSRGGIVQLLEGNFDIAASIVPAERLILRGAGSEATILNLANGVNDSMIKDHSSFASNRIFLNIESMNLEGNKANNTAGSGIDLQPAGAGHYWDVVMRDVYIEHFKDDGIISNDGHDYIIDHCLPEYNDGRGIVITGGGHCNIQYCTIKANSVGVDVTGTYHSKIHANFVQACVNQGIISDTRSMTWGNMCDGNCTATGAISNYLMKGNYGILFGNQGYFTGVLGDYNAVTDSAGWGAMIANNYFVGAQVQEVYQNGGVRNSTVRNNQGYYTEKSGTATLLSASTSIVVSHSLNTTPAAGDIMVTPMETWGNMTKFWIDTYTSTQFTIHADIAPGADTDFAWKAIVL